MTTVTSHAVDPDALESAIQAVYRGPLEDFIARRDALAKSLRASKRKPEADRVKALRKPSRTAWALDQAVHEEPSAIGQLEGAIRAAQAAHSQIGGEARAAAEALKTAVRAVAEAGARAATKLGHTTEPAGLVAAVRAVIGDAQAYSDLRAGCLVEVPEGGGLAGLAAITPLAASPAPTAAEPPAPTQSAAARDSGGAADPLASDAASAARAAAEREAARRARLRSAEEACERAHARAEEAARAAERAGTLLEAAEEDLARAAEAAERRRAELRRAREDAQAAAQDAADRERALARLRAAE